MILKKITMQNIRSYSGPTSIDLPMGTILFQGDVGCGKSSILSSIEFALFGLGDLDGRFLLRNGANRCSVELEFEISGKSFTVFRSLIKNSKTIVQNEGYIIEEGEKTDYSVSELKSRILEIINIKERTQTKTTSIIYRFAIFTPQEMMKQILTENQDRRLEILRRAFGIEEYNIVKKNIIDVGIPWLKVEAKTAKELSADLLDKQHKLESERKRIERISKEIANTSGFLDDLEIRISKIQKDLEELQKKKEEVVRLQESVPLLENKILNTRKHKTEIEEDLIPLQEDLEQIKQAEIDNITLKPKYDDYLSKKLILSGLEKSINLFSRLEKEKIKFENIIEREKLSIKHNIERMQQEIHDNIEEINEGKNSIKIHAELMRQKDLFYEKLKFLPQFRKQSQILSDKISEHTTNKRSIIKELEKIRKELQDVNEIGEGAPCPKCKQKLTKEHFSTVINDFEVEKTRLNKSAEDLEDNLVLILEQRKKLEKDIVSLEKTNEELNEINKRLAEHDERKKNIDKLESKLKTKEILLAQQTKILSDEEYSIIEKRKLAELEQEMNRLSKDVESYEFLKTSQAQYESDEIESKYIKNTQIIKRKVKVEKDIDKALKNIQKLEIDIKYDIKELEKKQLSLDKSRGIVDGIRRLEHEKKEEEEKLMEGKTEIARKKGELDSNVIDELESEVSKKKHHFNHMHVFGQAYNWMNELFIPIVEDIEHHVLASINEEFNNVFQHWFNLLVDSDDITVEVDESFTPIIMQGGYSMDVGSLSGGEKTSVALAYRLALNGMIKKTASFQSHLLILDEPTDGFSREQLLRLRYVLRRAGIISNNNGVS